MGGKAKIISEKEFISSLERVTNPMHKALFCVLFGTGVRVGELVRKLSKDDIELMDNGHIKLQVETEKHRKRPLRVVYIPPSRDFIIRPILFWMEHCPTDILFTLSRQRAWKLTRKFFETKTHSFRHTDATRSGKRGFNIWEMKQRYGWADIKSSEAYVYASAEDSIKKL